MQVPTRSALVLAVTVVVALSALPASGGSPEPYERPGRNQQLTVGPNGECPTWYTQEVAISGDGRWAAFSVRGADLVPGEDVGAPEIFIRELRTGTLERGSVSSTGQQQEFGRPAYDPWFSRDGRYLVFVSNALNLADDKTGPRYDVFWRNRETGVTERVSVPEGGGQINGDTYEPQVSDDGRFVLFWSNATNLTAEGQSGHAYLRDRESGTTTLVSRRPDNTPGGQVFEARLIGDGSTVVYTMRDGGGFITAAPTYIYAYDVATGEVSLASPSYRGDRPNSWAEYPSVSRDGRYVAFMSDATDLIPRDTNRGWDAYVHDRATGLNERVSVGDLGAELGLYHEYPWVGTLNNHLMPHISPNGRWVTFLHSDEKVGGYHTWNTREVVLHDRWTRTTSLVSRRTDSGEASNQWMHLAYAADNGSVLFRAAGRLHPDDSMLAPPYVRERGPDTGVAWLEAVGDADDIEVTGAALFGAVELAAAGSSPTLEGSDRLLRAVEVHYRPDRADLVVRILPRFLPVIAPVVPGQVWWLQPTAGLTTPLLYGFEVSVDGLRYEVRTVGAGRGPDEPFDVHIELHRCAAACELVTTLDGSYGTIGHEIVAGLPLAAIGAQAGSTLTGMRSYVGSAATGSARLEGEGTELGIPDADIPETSVALAVGPAAREPPEEAFAFPATADRGVLTGRVPLSAVREGDAIWGRACVGEVCGADFVESAGS